MVCHRVWSYTVIVDSAAIDEGEVQKIEGNDLWVTPSYHTRYNGSTMDATVGLSKDYIRILIVAFSMFPEPILENLFEEHEEWKK